MQQLEDTGTLEWIGACNELNASYASDGYARLNGCLLSIGYRPIDLTTGDFTGSLPAGTIHVRSHSADVGEDNYQAVTLTKVLRGVTDAVP